MKQVLVVRKDLKMRRGKECAQCAHASLAVLTRLFSVEYTKNKTTRSITTKNDDPLQAWLDGGVKKVTVYVESEAELLDVYSSAKAAGLHCALVKDAGLTEFDGVPTHTVVAVGPAREKDVDKITGNLPLY